MRLVAVSPSLVGARLARSVRWSRNELLLRAGERLTVAMVRHLTQRGVSQVYVNDAYLPDIAPDADVDEPTRSLLNETLHKALDGVAEGDALDVEGVERAASLLTRQLGDQPSVLFSLSRLRAIDEATVQHSVNVAILAMLAASQFGLAPEDRTALGMGGLLHDIGKTLVPLAVLRKPGPLDEAEWAEMRRHPELGHRLIVERAPTADPRVAEVALRHHERLDGKGYPDGLGGDAIALFARLTMVADVWDAMVSARWYKPSFPFAYVASYMRQSRGLDPEAVEALLARVALFPTGSLARLTTGALAWVVGQDPKRPTMPLVMILTDSEGGPVTPYVAELAGGSTQIYDLVPDLPDVVKAHCQAHSAVIARALDALELEKPSAEVRREAAPRPLPGANGRSPDGSS